MYYLLINRFYYLVQPEPSKPLVKRRSVPAEDKAVWLVAFGVLDLVGRRVRMECRPPMEVRLSMALGKATGVESLQLPFRDKTSDLLLYVVRRVQNGLDARIIW